MHIHYLILLFKQIRVLEDELKAEKEKSNATVLESENDSLVQERDKLLQKVADAENTTAELRSQYSLLTVQCKIQCFYSIIRKFHLVGLSVWILTE